MSYVAIRVEGLGKQYRLDGPRVRYSTLRDQIRRWRSLRAMLRRAHRSEHRPPFWALKDVSFQIEPGEVVGIIGRNGAGKSTLLKILSRITEPTEGTADIHGRVGSLLEVGTGFHPELTGRENIFLNGAILGMRRAEITRKFAEIVAFAGVEEFIDTPVKHYSSGMYMRLAFAVAAHLEPEILVVDEILAVGDAEFQKRCLGKMGEVARSGRTVLFVSHNIHAIKSLCTRGILLKSGHVSFQGSANESVYRYLESMRSGTSSPTVSQPITRPGTGEWRFTEVMATKPLFDPDEPKEIRFRLAPTGPDAGPIYLSGLLVNEEGTILSQLDSRLTGSFPTRPEPVAGRLRIAGLWLKPGKYSIDLFACTLSNIVDHFEQSADFEVSPLLPYPLTASPNATASAMVLADFDWRIDS